MTEEKELESIQEREMLADGKNNIEDTQEEEEEIGYDPYETEEEEYDSDSSDQENRLMDGNSVVIIREEPEEPYHTLYNNNVESDEPVIEDLTEKKTEEPTTPASDQADTDDEEPKKKKFGIFNKSLKRRNGKDPEPKPEKEYDVDSIHERWRRWKLIRNEGYVKLKVLSRTPDEEYFLETTLVKFEDLPKDAVQVTNEKHTYCLDTIKTSEWYFKEHFDPNENFYESQFTASDAALYMTSNKIDNALAIKWTEFSHVDYKKYLILGVAALAVVLFIFMRMR